jgi:5-methylcytosine-specific restriction endonuclease McrA
MCTACGRVVFIRVNKVRRQKFCGLSCAYKNRRSVSLRGPRNGRWRGGRVLSYGANWKRVKERVRARDRVCHVCRKTPKENGRALDVHHINPYRFSGDNSLDNLVALCRSCHMRANDHGRRGAATLAGPRQLTLRPLSQRELRRQRGEAQRERRRRLQGSAFAMHAKGASLREIARELGVSHQTVANWLAAVQQGRPRPALGRRFHDNLTRGRRAHVGILDENPRPGSSVGRALG